MSERTPVKRPAVITHGTIGPYVLSTAMERYAETADREIAERDATIKRLREALETAKNFIAHAPEGTWGYEENDGRTWPLRDEIVSNLENHLTGEAQTCKRCNGTGVVIGKWDRNTEWPCPHCNQAKPIELREEDSDG